MHSTGEFESENINFINYSFVSGVLDVHKEGYIPFAIRSYELTDDHLILTKLTLLENQCYYSIKNYDNSSLTGKLIVRIGYIKV